MKTLLLSASCLLFATACHTPYFATSEPEEILVKLEGTPGLNVCGGYYVDGVKQTVHGEIPMNIRAVGRDFHCDFIKTGAGDLTLALNHGCKSYGKVVSTTTSGGVKAMLRDGDSFVRTSVSGY